MSFGDIPLIGSFQRGRRIRSGNALETVWRQIERAGTVERLQQLAAQRGTPSSSVRTATLQIRQAIELRRAAREASILTKPLLLYYSTLNLMRGVMRAYGGVTGAGAHGLTYVAGPSLLECKARVARTGTFAEFAVLARTEPHRVAQGTEYSLRDLFAQTPEMYRDFALLDAGPKSVVRVHVLSMMRGPTHLRFFFPDGTTETEFEQNWQAMFPWFVEFCDYDGPMTLRLKVLLQPGMVEEFCNRYLITELHWREDAVWFDQRECPGVMLLPRLVIYDAALFILSNISRYEPHFLEEPTTGLTNMGYFLATFLDNAERFVPQMMLSLIEGPLFFD